MMMTHFFEEALEQLFAHLGVAYARELENDDYPALVLDEKMLIHFIEHEDRIEIVATLGGLPKDAQILSQLLTFNYSEAALPICFASDANGRSLLAIMRLPLEVDHKMLLAALQSLVVQIEACETVLTGSDHHHAQSGLLEKLLAAR